MPKTVLSAFCADVLLDLDTLTMLRLSRRAHLHQLRQYSSRSQPRFRVPAHVAAFSLLLAPALLYFVYFERASDDERLQQELRERYANDIQVATTKNKHMAEFFQHAIRNPDGKVEDQLDAVLKGGKGDKKRLYAVDERLYGTKEGVEERKRMEEQLAKERRKKKRRKRKKKEAAKAAAEAAAKEPSALSKTVAGIKAKIESVDKQQVATVAVAASLAAAVGFLVGGRRNQ